MCVCEYMHLARVCFKVGPSVPNGSGLSGSGRVGVFLSGNPTRFKTDPRKPEISKPNGLKPETRPDVGYPINPKRHFLPLKSSVFPKTVGFFEKTDDFRCKKCRFGLIGYPTNPTRPEISGSPRVINFRVPDPTLTRPG